MFLRYARHLLEGNGLSWNIDQGPEFGLTSLVYLILTLPAFAATARTSALALSLCSVLFGLCFVGLALRLGSAQARGQARLFRMVNVLFVAICLAAAAPDLAAHFTSGMDTTLAMLWVALTLHVFQGQLLNPSPKQGSALSILAGLTFSVRPDALILVAPLVLFFVVQAEQSSIRRRFLPLLVFLTVILLQLLLAWCYFGQMLPNPFFVKSGSHYGGVFQDFYQGLGVHYLLLFLSSLPWICAAFLAQLCFCRHSLSKVQMLLLGSAATFLAYHAAIVTPIMGFHARFLFPALPLFLLLATDSVMALCKKFCEREDWVQKLARYPFPILFLPVVLFASALKPAETIEKLSSFRWTSLQVTQWELPLIYRERFTKSWAGLDAIAELPGRLSFASTEVGLLGALNLDRPVLDLTGLQDRRFLVPFNAQTVMDLLPDVIYMPFPHYAEMLAAIEASPRFQTEYRYFPAAALDTRFGVALLKKSPYFAALVSILDRTSGTERSLEESEIR